MPEPVPLTRVMAIHALAYCERLFYLEEVEEIRVADERVYAGRTLHETLPEPDGEYQSLILESETWGLKGKVDYLRYRDGALVAYEHKRGRSKGDEAWGSDRLQIIAYCALLSEHLERSVPEGRIRYNANNKTVRVTVDDAALVELRAAVARARELAASIERPPVTENDNLCLHCSLAPVCLPEEERFLRVLDEEEEAPEPHRLFPANDPREILQICEAGTRVSKSGEQIVVRPLEGEPRVFPGKKVGSIVLHGGVQISTQLIHYAAANDIGIHWLTGGGSYAAWRAPRSRSLPRAMQHCSCSAKIRHEVVRTHEQSDCWRLRPLVRLARTVDPFGCAMPCDRRAQTSPPGFWTKILHRSCD
jgi:CRISP-associated protein Cas1